MNKHQLITSYKSMMYVARAEGIELEERYEQLDELLLQDYDYSLTDMLDNMEVIYKQLKEVVKWIK